MIGSRFKTTVAAVLVTATVAVGSLMDDAARFASRTGARSIGTVESIIVDIRLFLGDEGLRLADTINSSYSVTFDFAQRNIGRLRTMSGMGIGEIRDELSGAVIAMQLSPAPRLRATMATLDASFAGYQEEVREVVKGVVCDTVDDLLESRWDFQSIPEIDVANIVRSQIRELGLRAIHVNADTAVALMTDLPGILISEARGSGIEQTNTSSAMANVRIRLLARCLGL